MWIHLEIGFFFFFSCLIFMVAWWWGTGLGCGGSYSPCCSSPNGNCCSKIKNCTYYCCYLVCFSRACESVKLREEHFSWNISPTLALFCLLFNHDVASLWWSLQVSSHMVRQSSFADGPSWRCMWFLLWVFVCFREFFSILETRIYGLFSHFPNKLNAFAK